MRRNFSHTIAFLPLNAMLTRNFAIAAIFCITLFALPARSQDAQKIVDQYIKAAGGSRALSKATTVIIEGTFHTSNGKNGTYALNNKLTKGSYSELVIGEVSLIDA